MNAPTLTYEVIDNLSLDCAEFSLCPKCSSKVIRLADDCSVCGWSDRDKLQGRNKNCSSKSFSTLNNCSSKNAIASENKLAIPCLIKQPKQAEVKGVIQKDLGDRFTVYIPSDSSTVNVPKLLVYPDFSDIGDELLQGGLNKCSGNCSSTLSKSSLHNDINVKVSDTSVKCSSKTSNPPCTENSKTRRQKGEGSGHIYYRTVTRNGRNYQQAYYQWRENGKQKTKYIPVKLLPDIEEAEEQKLPVTKILEILQGGLEKCSSNCSSTFPDAEVLAKDESVETIDNCSSQISSPPSKDLEKIKGNLGDRYLTINNEEDSKNRVCSTPKDVLAINESPKGYRSAYVGTNFDNCSSNFSNPPCTKKKRSAGYGGGYIEYREVKRNHKVYGQYWYHYEFWENGRCVEKGSKYIPKRLIQKIERMNREKVAVREILEALKNKKKR
ncbi:MAG TPA: hypothetical protein ACFCUY_13770 [Xenococcaceae cyanobacterium]